MSTGLRRVLLPSSPKVVSSDPSLLRRYSRFVLPSLPIAPPLSYASLPLPAPYWQQPGRSIVESLLTPLPFPSNSVSALESSSTISTHGNWDTSSFERFYFDLPPSSPSTSIINVPGIKETHEPVLLKHQWTISDVEAYLRTWSSAHSYNEVHSGEGGDCVAAFLERFGEVWREQGLREEERVEVAWKMGGLRGRKEGGET